MANIEGRPLTDVLGELDNGDFLAEITAELYKVVRAVQETRKAGGLKLTIKLSPTGKGSVELDANTQAFAEPGFLAATGKATIMAVMDYHDTAAPNYGAHAAIYMPRYSEQWERWHKVCAAPLKQAEFAEFVEETRADIVEPDAARLMDCVRAFKASKRVEFDSVTYQPNGDVTLVYDEKTEQKGASGPLPAYLKLGIPVYFRGERFGVPVFVRFKVGGGAVGFQLKMDRSDVIEDEAFLKLVEKVKTDTGIAVYMGRT